MSNPVDVNLEQWARTRAAVPAQRDEAHSVKTKPVRRWPVAGPIRNGCRRHATPLLLLLLTLLGGVLRFSYLDKPPIWFDEAATYARTCGTYLQMLDALEGAGFGPLHYHAYWWIKHGMPTWGRIEPVRVPALVKGDGIPTYKRGADKKGMVDAKDLKPLRPLVASGNVNMTPFMLRLIPAICGTLMIPTMFWLAMELTGRRAVALLAAGMTACSAYLLNYSRDAKMYMDAWLLVAVNVASFLWWLRTRRGVPFWCWVVSGAAMVGLHLVGAAALTIELLILLTAPASHWRSLRVLPVAVSVPFVWLGRVGWAAARRRAFEPRAACGACWARLRRSWRDFRMPTIVPFLAGVALIAVGPYGYFVEFNRYAKRINDAGWQGSGLHWIDAYNRGRSGPGLAQYAASAFMTGWEWPRVADERHIHPRTLRLLKGSCIALAALLALGLLPWRWPVRWRLNALSHGAPVDPRVVARTASPDWLRVLWVMLWMLIPTYALYCASVRSYDGLFEWTTALRDVWRGNTWPKVLVPILALLAFVTSGHTWKMRLLRLAQFAGVVVVVALLLWGAEKGYDKLDATLDKTSRSWRTHGSLWIPRYLGIIWPAVIVAAAVLFMRLPTRPLRVVAVVLFVVVNLGQFAGRVFAASEPPVDRMVRDVVDTRAITDGSTRMYYNVQRPSLEAGLGPGTGVLSMPTARYYWLIMTGTQSQPDEVRGFDSRLDRNFPRSFGQLSNTIKTDVQRNARLTKLIVWDSFDPKRRDSRDKVLETLGSGWTRESEELAVAREHWTWKELFGTRRRVYVKKTTPATRPVLPTTIPATTSTTRTATRARDGTGSRDALSWT
jgi:hypothetical protein